MAGYIIHMAIAQEYLKKHNEEYNIDFIKGSIAPDFTKDKSKTHYGKSPAYTGLKDYLNNNEINNSFKRGEFLHLVTDYLFYNYYLTSFKKEDLHRDYDILNQDIIDKYNVLLIDEILDKVFYIEGQTMVIDKELCYKVIDEISNLDINQIINEINDNNKKWFHFNNLV